MPCLARILLVVFMLAPLAASAQLREFEITPVQNNRIPVFRDHPEMAAVIVNSSLTNLRFESNLEVVATLGDASQGEYFLIVRPVRQIVTVSAPGYQQGRITISPTEARQVLYFRVEPKPEVATNIVPANFQITPTDALVSIDGNRVDASKPVSIEIGSHMLKIEKQGYRTIEKEIRVSTDQNFFRETLTAIEPVPVRFRIQPAGATVFIDGMQAGVTDRNGALDEFRFPGTYELTLQLSGYVPETRTISVTETGTNTVTTTLVRKAGMLRLSVMPTDAIITLNDAPFGTSPSKELVPGTYRLVVSKSGYLPYEETLDIAIGQTMSRTIDLVRNAGTLRLIVTPTDAMVLLNRKSTDATLPIELAPGMVRVEVSKEGHEPFAETVEIQRGKTISRTITLVAHLGGLQIKTVPVEATWSLTGADGKMAASGTGLARKSGIPVGNYTLLVKASGHQDQSETLRITRDQVLEKNVALREGPQPCTGVSDVDGNCYATVRIGNQQWMAENLRTTKYRDGTPIPNVTGNSRWGSLTTGAWAHYDNQTANESKYGKLYNWYVVADARNVCPVGWHVPSDSEWTMLSTHLGTDPVHKMKSTSGWSSSGNGSNASGFAGLPGGARSNGGTFGLVGRDGYFWSSTQSSAGGAWDRGLYYGSRDLSRSSFSRRHGFSVRCLRD